MDYLKDNTEVNNLLDSKYIKKINDIVNKYRNPSAHPEFMSLEKANECRKIMPDYSEVVIETNNLIMKKAVFADWGAVISKHNKQTSGSPIYAMED